MADTWTVGRLLNWTTDYLKQQQADTPRLDAEVLLAHVRGCQRIQLYVSFDTEVDEAQRSAFRELVKRRAKGAPVAYLVGQREFYSLPFRVTSDVLIPRPETEHLVIRMLDLAKSLTTGRAEDDPISIADVGTGSGIIAVCAAKHLPKAQVTAIDISPAALAIAQENAATHGVAERIEFREGDLLSPVAEEPAYDIIASNPPYITSAEYAELSPTVREFEPRGALEAGPLGTEVVAKLIPQAAARLRPGGWLLIEVSPMLIEAATRLLEADPRLESRPVIKDLAGLPRIVQAQRRA